MSLLRATLLRQSGWWVAFAAMFFFAFWPTFVWLAERFSAHDSFYSHGWLIPLAGCWLIWQRRRRLQACRAHVSYWGLALFLPSLLLHVLASWWRIHFVSGFAMLLALWGLIWTAWGFKVLWALRFPLVFLLFMIPLPGVLLIWISFKMKLLAASVAAKVVTLMGIPALQAGSMIRVSDVSVMVDDTCSGLRSLISLLALATLWTSLLPPSSKQWQRLAIVASSIPIALAANMARIVILILLAAIYGPKVAEGFLHYGSGVVVFGMALAMLIWLSRRLVKNPLAFATP